MKKSDVVFAAMTIALAVLCSANAYSQDKPSAVAYDLSKDKVAYIVTDAHLDTQWLYDIQRTSNEFVPSTLRQNFALFEKYPEYVFNFEGAYRYYLAKLHYPAEYARLKTYIEKGNWAVAGGMVDMPDVNVPSAESVMRNFFTVTGSLWTNSKRNRSMSCCPIISGSPMPCQRSQAIWA